MLKSQNFLGLVGLVRFSGSKAWENHKIKNRSRIVVVVVDPQKDFLGWKCLVG